MTDPHPTKFPPGQRVLLVDDEQAVLKLGRRLFERNGFTVDVASEREEGEALLATNEYQVLVADVRLSGAHGREGYELVRVAKERCPTARIIVWTGYCTPELRDAMRQLGADAVLEKPVSVADVVRLSQDLLANAPSV